MGVGRGKRLPLWWGIAITFPFMVDEQLMDQKISLSTQRLSEMSEKGFPYMENNRHHQSIRSECQEKEKRTCTWSKWMIPGLYETVRYTCKIHQRRTRK